ncbi:MAG TPA: hypothetical protein VMD55_11800 [Terracidiphilus sp.]|nr:hypothetical protein [Terracidiphilus sp.]
MKHFALTLSCVLILCASLAHAQSTAAPIHVSSFPGSDIGAKTLNAMATCNPSPNVPCVLVLDSPLASTPAGVLPPLCPQCSIQDQRFVERPAGTAGNPPTLLPSDTSVLDARYFGADPTGTLDSTAALLHAATVSCLPSLEVEPVLLSPGLYRIVNLDLSHLRCAPYFETPNDQSVQLEYNGTGTPGDYLIKLPNMSFDGFRGIAFNGENPTTGAMATYGIWLTGRVDNNFWIQRSRFESFLSHAIYHTGNGFTNWHMDHVRFDGVGGCGVYLTGNNHSDGQPFSLTDFTLDNRRPYDRLGRKWLADNHIGNGVNWGDAVVCVNNGTNLLLDLEDARIEDNAPQVVIGNNDNAALVREWNTRPDQELTVNIYDVMTADVIPAGSTVEPALVSSAEGHVRLTVRGSESLNAIACIKDVATQTYYGDRFCSQDGLFTWGYDRQQAGGISMGAAGTIPNRIESISDSAFPGNFARFHLGDLLLRPDTEARPGIDGPVRWVTAPLTGACETAPHVIAADASVTAGNPSISFGPGTSVAKLGIVPGDNITVGAAGSADKFPTQVASVSYAGNTITVNPAPQSSLSPAQLGWLVCTVHELPGAQSAAAPPKTGTWATGERVWNTNIAPGQPTFWACAAGGTPCKQWISGPAYGPAAP